MQYRNKFTFLHTSCLRHIQSWQKKFVLGCVIAPLRQQAESRNLGHTFLANSVCTVSAKKEYKQPVGEGGRRTAPRTAPVAAGIRHGEVDAGGRGDVAEI